MPEDFYGVSETEPKAPEMETEEVDEETSLLPKSMLGGKCKEGDKYTVVVKKIYGDEAEVGLVKEEKKEEPSETDEVENRMMAAGGM